jgi:hypothetical protein
MNKKVIIFFLFALTTVNCQKDSIQPIKYSEGDKFLYSEYIDENTTKVYMYSLDEEKEYEIPLNGIKIESEGGKFSPDGKTILMKGERYTDDIYFYDLLTSQLRIKKLSILNDFQKSSYPFFDYLDDSTVAFKGIGRFNFLIISLKTEKLLYSISARDTFYISSFEVDLQNNYLIYNYGLMGDLNSPLNIMVYDYIKQKVVNVFKNTGYVGHYIESSDKVFLTFDLSFLDIHTGEKEYLNLDMNLVDSVIFPQSFFINEKKLLMYNGIENDFYLCNLEDNTTKRLTHSNRDKTLMDVYIDSIY